MEKKAVYKYLLRASLLLAPLALASSLPQETIAAEEQSPATEALPANPPQESTERSDLSETPESLPTSEPDSNTEMATTPLAEVRQGDKGQEFTVQGKVISDVNAWGGNGFYIQDAAGTGVYVYPGKKQDVNRGDSVQFKGNLGDFNGELQLTKVTDLTKVADITVPAPTVTTIEGLTDQLQSTLVTLKDVTVGAISSDNKGNSSFNLTDVTGQQVAVRVDSRTGISNTLLNNLISENDTIHITAILSTYRGKNQLKPFLENQFEVVKKGTAAPPEETTVTVGQIQGEGHISPLEGQTVTVQNVVVTYVANKNHFYIQDLNPDKNPKTSDGINVFLPNHNVALGDTLTITGKVVEYLGSGYNEKDQTDLTTTQLAATTVVKEGSAAVPTPIILGTDRLAPTKIVEDDAFTSFDPDTDGLDFWESLEGMVVGIDNAKVLGPQTNKEVYVVPGNYAGPMNKVGGLTLETDNPHPEKIAVLFDKNLITKTGDSFLGRIYGPISYGYTNYKLLAKVADSPKVTDGGVQPEATSIVKDPKKLSIASYNIENFSANNKTTNNAKVKRIATSFVQDLKSPDIITLIEVQDNNGSTDDGTVDASQSARRLIEAIKAQGGPEYRYIDIDPENNKDGGAPGSNIRTGFLYNPERVSLSDKPKGDAHTPAAWENGALIHSIARIEPAHQAWTNSRKPVIAEFQFQGQTVNVIAVHLNSKRGDNGYFGKVQPVTFKSEDQRHQMATLINQFIAQGMNQNPDLNVAMLGDFNDFEFSKTMELISGDILSNLVSRHDKDDRFSYFYQGNNQSLDNIVLSNNLLDRYEFDMVHVNSIFMKEHGRASDHDPLLVQLDLKPKETVTPETEKPSEETVQPQPETEEPKTGEQPATPEVKEPEVEKPSEETVKPQPETEQPATPEVKEPEAEKPSEETVKPQPETEEQPATPEVTEPEAEKPSEETVKPQPEAEEPKTEEQPATPEGKEPEAEKPNEETVKPQPETEEQPATPEGKEPEAEKPNKETVKPQPETEQPGTPEVKEPETETQTPDTEAEEPKTEEQPATPEVTEPEAEKPSEETVKPQPETEQPGTPEIKEPEIETPDTKTEEPKTEEQPATPEVTEPEAEKPSEETVKPQPETEEQPATPEVKEPEIETPDTKTEESKTEEQPATPEVKEPETETPDTEAEESKTEEQPATPEVKEPEVKKPVLSQVSNLHKIPSTSSKAKAATSVQPSQSTAAVPKELPKTGDNSQTAAITAGVSSTLALLLTVKSRRRKQG